MVERKERYKKEGVKAQFSRAVKENKKEGNEKTEHELVNEMTILAYQLDWAGPIGQKLGGI